MSLTLLPPEAQLLYRCASAADQSVAIRDLLAAGIDWDRFCALAEREQATPVVAARLRESGARVPTAVTERLRRMARVTAFKMDYLAQRVEATAGALERAGIPCVLLKGAALASTVYESFAERPMVDLDILVPTDRAEDAVAVLLQSGWLWRPDRSREGDYSYSHHLPALLDARGMEISLELHTSLFPPGHPFGVEAASVLRNAIRMQRGSIALGIPHPHHLLLHTCTHLAWSHLLRNGAWRAFRDVRIILGALGIERAEFVRLARSSGTATCCYWTLRLARELAGVAVPDELLAALRPPLPEFVLRRLSRHFALVTVPFGLGCPSVRVRRFMWSLGVLPRWSGHGGARPWELLTLTPEAREKRESRVGPRRGPVADAKARLWWKYVWGVLLGDATAPMPK